MMITPVTEGQYNHGLKAFAREMNEEQEAEERSQYIRQEKERIEESRKQEKREAMVRQAQSYYSNGVYLSKGTRLYNSPNTYSASNRTSSKNETWTVYSYQVDEDGGRIWLKVKSTSGYYWVYKMYY